MDPAAPVVSAPSAHPVRIDLVAPNEIARWRPFVHFLMAIPHLIINQALGALSGAVTFIAFFAIVFTKRYPEGLFRIAVMAQRYGWRTMSFAFYLREAYPPFEFSTDLEDPETDPARYSIEYPGEMSRWLAFVKFLLVLPHFFVFIFLAIGVAFVWFLSFFAVLFTGKYPEGMRNYVVGVARWGTRMGAYIGLMTDDYPPFSLH